MNIEQGISPPAGRAGNDEGKKIRFAQLRCSLFLVHLFDIHFGSGLSRLGVRGERDQLSGIHQGNFITLKCLLITSNQLIRVVFDVILLCFLSRVK